MSVSRKRFPEAVFLALYAVVGCDHGMEDLDPGAGASANAPRDADRDRAPPPAEGAAIDAGATARPPDAQPASATAIVLTDWSFQAAAMPIGTRATYRCAPGGRPTTVWGTDLYTADSSVCTAAVHAGVTTLAGNTDFTIEVVGGASSYLGSTRNQIATNNYGPYPKAFRFIASSASADAGAPASVQTLTIDWSTSAATLPVGTTVTYRCLPGGSPGSVYGTDVYTADSSICGAAVHAGKTKLERNTDFTIQVADGAATFVGSTRNGVTSRSYGPYSKTFRFTP